MENSLQSFADTPLGIEIDATNVCSPRCFHCHNTLGRTGKPSFISLDEIRAIRDLAGDKPMRLAFTGTGDFLCHPQWREALDILAHTPIHVVIHTNGLLLDPAAINDLWGAASVKLVHVSIDAATEATYGRIRGGSWERLMTNIRALARHRERKALRISMTVMQSNLAETASFCHLACELDVDGVVFQKLQETTYPHSQSEGFTFVGEQEKAVDLDRFQELLAIGSESLVSEGRFVELWRLPEAESQGYARAFPSKQREDEHFRDLAERSQEMQRQLDGAACALPWLELNRVATGDFRSCCAQKNDTAYGGRGASPWQAWTSPKLARDRELMARGIRPAACDAGLCDIARLDLREEVAAPELSEFDGRIQPPSWIGIETTRYCNLKCRMCLQYLDGTTVTGPHMDLETFDRIAAQVMPFVERWQPSVSGEPTTSPHFPEMLDRASQFGVRADIVTNATLLTEALVERIKPNLAKVVFSIDGADAETFEAIRRGADFKQTLARAVHLMEACRRAQTGALFGFNCTLMVRNLASLPNLIDLAADLGVDYVTATPVFPVSEEMRSQSLAHDPATTRHHIDLALARARERRIKLLVLPVDRVIEATTQGKADRSLASEPGHIDGLGRREWDPAQEGHGVATVAQRPMENKEIALRSAARRRSCFPADYEASESPPARDSIWWCEFLWNRSYVSVEGDVRPCCVYGSPIVGNVNVTPFDRIWNNDAYRDMRTRLTAKRPAAICKGCMHIQEVTDPAAIDTALRGQALPTLFDDSEVDAQSVSVAKGRWIGYRSPDDPDSPFCFDLERSNEQWKGRLAQPSRSGHWRDLDAVEVNDYLVKLQARLDGQPLLAEGSIAGHGRSAEVILSLGSDACSLQLTGLPWRNELPRPRRWKGEVEVADGTQVGVVVTQDAIHAAYCSIDLPSRGIHDWPAAKWLDDKEDLVVESLVSEGFLRVVGRVDDVQSLTGVLLHPAAGRWHVWLDEFSCPLVMVLSQDGEDWSGQIALPSYQWGWGSIDEIVVTKDSVNLRFDVDGQAWSFSGVFTSGFAISGSLITPQRRAAYTLDRQPSPRVLNAKTWEGAILLEDGTAIELKIARALNVHGATAFTVDLPTMGVSDWPVIDSSVQKTGFELFVASSLGIARLQGTYLDAESKIQGLCHAGWKDPRPFELSLCTP